MLEKNKNYRKVNCCCRCNDLSTDEKQVGDNAICIEKLICNLDKQEIDLVSACDFYILYKI